MASGSRQLIIHSPRPCVSNKSTLSLKQRKKFINAKLKDKTPLVTQIPQKSFARVALCCVSKWVFQVCRAIMRWKNLSPEAAAAAAMCPSQHGGLMFSAGFSLFLGCGQSWSVSAASSSPIHQPQLCLGGHAALQAAPSEISRATPCHFGGICLNLQVRWRW